MWDMAARNRKPAELDRKDKNEQDTKPEDRHGNAGESEHHTDIVQNRVATNRGECTEDNAEQRTGDGARNRQLDRGGKLISN